MIIHNQIIEVVKVPSLVSPPNGRTYLDLFIQYERTFSTKRKTEKRYVHFPLRCFGQPEFLNTMLSQISIGSKAIVSGNLEQFHINNKTETVITVTDQHKFKLIEGVLS